MSEELPLHVLEVGVKWPPETFLAGKFAALAARGLRISVAPNLVSDPLFTIEGVEVMAAEPPAAILGIIAGALGLAARSPKRLLRLLRNVALAPPVLRRRHGSRLRLLAMYLPLARFRPDVVQFEWNVAAVDHLPLFGVWDCPVVVSCRGSDLTVFPHVPGMETYAERLSEVLGRATAVHCVAGFLVAEAVRSGMTPGKARIVRSAVDAETFRPPDPEARRAPDGSFRILVIAEMRWEKGCEYALQAVRTLVDRGVPVQLSLVAATPAPGVAPSAEQQRVRHTVSDLGLEAHVRLLPPCGAEQVVALLREADALMHASLAEGIPNVVLEAMACAVPVVTSDCGGVREAVRDGREGYVVATREPEQLAAALRKLWLDPAQRRRMGCAGRRRILTEFSRQAQVDGFLALYREVAA